MADLLMIAIVVGFIATCVAYTNLCERIVHRHEPEAERRRREGESVR